MMRNNFIGLAILIYVMACAVAFAADDGKTAGGGKTQTLKGGVSQSELIDNLERVGIKCGVMGKDLQVLDVHMGTSAFNKGVQAGDIVKSLEPANGGFKLNFLRDKQIYQVLLHSSAMPYEERLNHKQLEADITQAASDRMKKMTGLNVSTGELSNTTMLDAIDNVHIAALRRTSDTDAVEKQTLEGLRWVPPAARAIVWDSGVRVLVTPSILELDESFKTAKPRGVHGGYTAVAGLFMGGANLIAVSERVQYRNDLPRVIDSRGVVCHEFGHAYDSCLARKFGTFHLFTRTKKFKDIYHDDVTRLTNTQRQDLEYFCQTEGGAGESECFAQLFSILCLPSSRITNRDHELEHGFPKTKEFIKAVMADPNLCKNLTEED